MSNTPYTLSVCLENPQYSKAYSGYPYSIYLMLHDKYKQYTNVFVNRNLLCLAIVSTSLHKRERGVIQYINQHSWEP